MLKKIDLFNTASIQKTSENIKIFINIIVVFLLLNLLSNNMGHLKTGIVYLSSIYLMIGFVLFNLPYKEIRYIFSRESLEKCRLFKKSLGFCLILLAFLLVVLTEQQIIWLGSITMFLLGLEILLNSFNQSRKELFYLTITSFLYSVFYVSIYNIPIIWNIIRVFSLNISSIIGNVLNNPILIGPSINGLWIILVFLVFNLVVFFISFERNNFNKNTKYFLLSTVSIFLAWILYQVFFSYIRFESNDDITVYLFVLFFICSFLTGIYFFVVCKDLKKSYSYQLHPKKFCVVIVVLILLFSIFINIDLDVSVDDSSSPSVLFYGRDMVGSWDIPHYGSYGRNALGMFGLLPVYLNISGYKTSILADNYTSFTSSFISNNNITNYVNLSDYCRIFESDASLKDLLSDIDIFVVVSINQSFTEDEKNIIWDFVESRGSLLVLGDHTNVGGIQDPLNDLLEPTSIRFRFDSAIPIDSDSRWITCYQGYNHPINQGIHGFDEVLVSVGASLDMGFSSYPVLIGKYGLSDIGNHSNPDLAFLGDYAYNHGEQIGDVILSAYGYYGNGKVLVFGDTSTFQNSAAPYSLGYIQNIFSWLNSKQTMNSELLHAVIAVILLALIAVSCIYLRMKHRCFCFVFLPVIFIIGILVSMVFMPVVYNENSTNSNIAYIDISHIERFNIESFTDNSINGLITNLMRNNYQPIFLRNFDRDAISDSKIVIFNAPTQVISTDETVFLKKYMYDGGIVIVTSGFEDKNAVNNILYEFSLDIANTPLGPVPYIEDNLSAYQNSPRFVDSWPIIYNTETSNIKSFYNFTIPGWDDVFNLIVFVKHGSGGLLLISDSQFLLDKNIESIYDYWPGNILLLKYIIDDFRENGGNQ